MRPRTGSAAAPRRGPAGGAITAALDLGGTVTGEHGVGLLRRDGLEAELDPAVTEIHRAVRRALDPHGILTRARSSRPSGTVGAAGFEPATARV